MLTHIKILGWLHVVFAIICILIGLGVFAFFGSIAGLVGFSDPSEGKFVAIPILGALGGIVLVFMLIISVPGLIVGWGLLNLRSWSRVLGIVLSALHLLNVPFGTALGIYGLWVLLNDQTTAILERGTLPWPAQAGPPAGPPYTPR